MNKVPKYYLKRGDLFLSKLGYTSSLKYARFFPIKEAKAKKRQLAQKYNIYVDIIELDSNSEFK